MYPNLRRHDVGLRGRRVPLSLLVVLVSHLVLMATPAHAGMAPGIDTHAAVAHAPYAPGEGCVGPAGHDALARGDCAIQGTTPARPMLDLPVASTSPGRMDRPPREGLMPAQERRIWPPPLPDLQVLFQVFRI